MRAGGRGAPRRASASVVSTGAGSSRSPSRASPRRGRRAGTERSFAFTPSPSSGTRAAFMPLGAGSPNAGVSAGGRRPPRAPRCRRRRRRGGGRSGSRRRHRRGARGGSGSRGSAAPARFTRRRSALAGFLPIWVVGSPRRVVRRNARQEDRRQVDAVLRGGAQCEEGVQDPGQLRLQVVALELLVVGRVAAVPEVLLPERDDDLVDERLGEAGDLLPPRPAVLGDDRARGRGVDADDRVGAVDVGRTLLGPGQLSDRHLDGDRVDAVALEAVDAAHAEPAGGRAAEADQVEGAAQVNIERVVALAGEDLGAVLDGVDRRRDQRLVVRSRARADVVRRGQQIPAEGLHVGPALRVLGDLADRVGLDQVEVGVRALLGVERDLAGVVEEGARVLGRVSNRNS